MKKAIAVVLLALSCAACLQAENRHAFYLERDGSATWAVLEEDVGFNAGDRADGGRADRAYLRRARRGETAIAVALRQVGATRVETTIVRGEPPFTVWTQARFESAAWMLESFLETIGFEAESTLRFDGERTTLSFRFRESPGNESVIASAEGPAGSLVEPVEQYRFVLAEGRFVEATGFRVAPGDTVAVMLDPDEVEEASEPDGAFYSLTWSNAR